MKFTRVFETECEFNGLRNEISTCEELLEGTILLARLLYDIFCLALHDAPVWYRLCLLESVHGVYFPFSFSSDNRETILLVLWLCIWFLLKLRGHQSFHFF